MPPGSGDAAYHAAFDELISRMPDRFAISSVCGFAATAAITYGAWDQLARYVQIGFETDEKEQQNDAQFGQEVDGAGDRVSPHRHVRGIAQRDPLVVLRLGERRQQHPAYRDRILEPPADLAAGQDDEVLQEAPGLGELVVDVEQLGQQLLVTDPVLQILDDLETALQWALRAPGDAHQHRDTGGPGLRLVDRGTRGGLQRAVDDVRDLADLVGAVVLDR